MRKGEYDEGAVTLRLKGDLSSANPQMWDSVAYRIKKMPHPKTGDTWCIYPTYDYSHPIIDSLENISYSMCSMEFESRREIYYWVLDALGLYKPKVWEFSRLNINCNVTSKRKLKDLVEKKYVSGWDDPRLLTIRGMRRRGYPAEALQRMWQQLGVSRDESTLDMHVLENWVRKFLEPVAPRALVVADPLKVIIENIEPNQVCTVKCVTLPSDPSKSTHDVPLTRVVYIEQDDFCDKNPLPKNFRGLAPGQTVKLKHGPYITCKQVERIGDKIERLICTADFDKKPEKGERAAALNWVSEPSPKKPPLGVELRLYEHLFTETPRGANWLKKYNPNSLVVKNGFADPSVATAKEGSKFQFEGLGYFTWDPDSITAKKLIFNRTTKLRYAGQPQLEAKTAAPANSPDKAGPAARKYEFVSVFKSTDEGVATEAFQRALEAQQKGKAACVVLTDDAVTLAAEGPLDEQPFKTLTDYVEKFTKAGGTIFVNGDAASARYVGALSIVAWARSVDQAYVERVVDSATEVFRQ